MSTKKETVTQDVTEKTTVQEVKTVETEVKALVYVGPTIVGTAVQYTTFNNGLSKELEDAIESNPSLGGLVVNLEELPKAMESINKKDGAFYILFKKFSETKKGE